ncbi:hypothetical protein EXIGLDRAFT_775641 [Exidia glandulosa HHB12029]|uniref:Protein kinase domain-containing protein n=1 Tax=Exidia glandulosa HHB12029 TaxID=1314781 RepID=A0A165DTY7_EXIGL|nr:hypothetical protein EXIGLDRAFT_775641 [Exidia glandulosa HHB12029]
MVRYTATALAFQCTIQLIKAQIHGFIAAYHAMFNCGVAWEDTAMRNIIWPYPPAASAKPDGEIVRSTEWEWVPVCLDFGFARPFELPWEKASQLGCAFNLLWRDYPVGYGLDYTTVRELVEQTIMRDRDMMDMLDMTGDKDLEPYIQHLLP